MSDKYSKTISTPIGLLKLTCTTDALVAVEFTKEPETQSAIQPEILLETETQLKAYFEGNLKNFSLNLNPTGTGFQQKIWELVQQVSFGTTASYLEIAKLSGSEKNTRAVGLANGKNPIPIIIPCHRIVGFNGKLTGYAGGLDKKRWLLVHEQQFSAPSGKLF